ncbi:hypothetical protein CERZMDRAFT_105877 [Cercospora zeae-maydis SCOH1-5]|uniref:Uncharacterized protein n=1 Tax=Cercospora zeae-maydis SCOH1-5 TaxID=717836 RepID=A0A6A6FIQ1_9PEZI|nr:hypothetical protein CERZMDRAFT_105877 [Cercospora zeae-maydis SCOH1-5]
MASDKVVNKLDALFSLTPLRTTFRERHQRSASASQNWSKSDQYTTLSTSSSSRHSHHSSSYSATVSPCDVPTPIGEKHSPVIIVDSASPTDTDWSAKYRGTSKYSKLAVASPILSATPFEHPGTALFDDTRERFRNGISTLDNLLRYMEAYGPRRCKDFRRGIDSLLDNLVAMAKWLVGYLETAKTAAETSNSSWTKSAVVGLRVDLHQYSWKIMKLTMLLKEGGSRHGLRNHSI